MSETRTTTWMLAVLLIATALVIGTGVLQAGAADASHIDRGHAFQGRRGITPRHHHQCRPQTPFALPWVRCGVHGGVVGGATPLPLVRSATGRAPWLGPAGQGARVSGHIASAPRQEQDLHAFIEPLSPLPGQVLAMDSSHAYIAARIAANAAIVRVDLRLDGAALHPEIVGRDDVDATIFYQPQHWRTGRHTIQVRVWDAAGQITTRLWTFRMTT